MTYKQLVNAYAALTKMGGTTMDIKAAMELYKVRKTLEPYYEFCVEREQVIMEQHGGSISGGNVVFPDAEKAALAQADLNTLYFAEVEDSFMPTEVQLDNMNGCSMTLNDIEALDGLVAFI